MKNDNDESVFVDQTPVVISRKQNCIVSPEISYFILSNSLSKSQWNNKIDIKL